MRLVAVALHRLGRQRDDRQRLEARHRADRARRLVAVHLGHHHVEQDEVDVGVLVQALDALAAVLGEDDLHPAHLQRAREREDVADVVVDDEDPLALEDRVGGAQLREQLARRAGSAASERCRNSAVSSTRRSGEETVSRISSPCRLLQARALVAVQRLGRVDDERQLAQDARRRRRRRAARTPTRAVAARAAAPRSPAPSPRSASRAPARSATGTTSTSSPAPSSVSVAGSRRVPSCDERQALDRPRVAALERRRARGRRASLPRASERWPAAPARSADSAPAGRPDEVDRDGARVSGCCLSWLQQRVAAPSAAKISDRVGTVLAREREARAARAGPRGRANAACARTAASASVGDARRRAR